MRFLQATFVWNGPQKTIEQLKPIFDLAQDWVSLGPIWIIYTGEDVSTWAARARAVIGPSDYVIVCELTNITGANGWMPPWIWDWINKSRIDGPDYGLMLRSINR